MRFVKNILLQDFMTYEPLKNAFLSDGDESQLFNYDAEQLNDGEEYITFIDELNTFVPIFSDDDVSKNLLMMVVLRNLLL